VASIDATLLRAETAAAQQDQRVDRLFLNPVARLIPNLPIAERLVSARATLTMDGASSLDLTVFDPDWLVEDSGVLDPNEDGRMNAVDVVLDTMVFRLAQAKRSDDPDQIDLVFEDRAVQLLRAHNRPMTASRGSMTRAQFIEKMVREVKTHPIPYYAPEKGRRQPVDSPDFPEAAPTRGTSGFDPGTKFKIKGALADSEQKRQLATALAVAEQEDAGPRATLAMVTAGIGESEWRAIPNRGGSPYGGVLQGKIRSDAQGPKQFDLNDTEEMVRSFLKGGKGFQGGGAIALAREHPDWTVGKIALTVEGSTSNFSSPAAGEAFYQAGRDEARKIVAAYNAGDQAGAQDDVLRVKAFQFTRGQSGKRESSWEAALRLAEEVNWRFFVAGGTAAFITDDRLMLSPASVVIEGPDDPALLRRPTYDWDHEKPAGDVEIPLVANRWAIRPGDVWALRNGDRTGDSIGRSFGPVAGRWLVHTAEYDLLNVHETTVTLTKPLAPHKEPAASVIEGTTGETPPQSTSGAGQTLKWARSKIGHFKEEFANNRGAELDTLEADFHMVGQPWCAIFATTAVAQSVGDRCKTAAVAQIRQWAQEGTHGYQRGFRDHPKPGDLMCFGTQHVALIEKVKGDTVTTIEGNTSANKVARLSRSAGSGDIVRPDYLDE
jgi:hypothetical protein